MRKRLVNQWESRTKFHFTPAVVWRVSAKERIDDSPGVLLYIAEDEGENEDEDQIGCSFDRHCRCGRRVVPEFVFVSV